MIKIAVVGGRDFTNSQYFKVGLIRVFQAYETQNIGSMLISGGCPTGADSMAEDFFHEFVSEDYTQSIEIYYADWDKHGKAAGPIRNREIANYSDVMVAFWDCKSKGTRNAISSMLKLKKPVYIFPY